MGMPSPRPLKNIYIGLRAVPDLKKNLRIPEKLLWKPQEEKRILQARKFLYFQKKFSIDKFLSELGYDEIDDPSTMDDQLDETTKKLATILKRRKATIELKDAPTAPSTLLPSTKSLWSWVLQDQEKPPF
jgi:hypothetical protein